MSKPDSGAAAKCRGPHEGARRATLFDTRSRVAGLLSGAALCATGALGGCGLFVQFDREKIETGTVICDEEGVCTGCVAAADCPAEAGCATPTCDSGLCGTIVEPSGASCEGDRVCDGAGHCMGGACAKAADCPEGAPCVDGVCCDTACGGDCLRCDVAGTIGQCRPSPAGKDPDHDCAGNEKCNGMGECQ